MAAPGKNYTEYPVHIDNTSSLPLAVDGVTGVKAESVNRHNEAIVAIETELGEKPSSTYGTVRARLDAIEAGGGGGGGGSISVSEGGAVVDYAVSNIDFHGGVEVTSVSSGHVKVDVSGTLAEQVQESFAVTNGQTIFTLSDTPLDDTAVLLFINGSKQEYSSNYTVSGTTLTWANSFSLVVADKVEVWYIVSASMGSGGGGGTALIVKESGTTIETNTNTINFIGLDVTSVSGGVVSVTSSAAPSDKSKIKVFRNTSSQTGNATTLPTTVVWNATSSLLALDNAHITSNMIIPESDGTFLVNGQLTLQPTVDAISKVTINVLLNAVSAVYTFVDSGTTWAVGVPKSFNFNFIIDLTVGDTLEVEWIHVGSSLSEMELVFGENNSWFGFSSL